MSQDITASVADIAPRGTDGGKVIYLEQYAFDDPTGSLALRKEYAEKQKRATLGHTTNIDTSSFKNLDPEVRVALQDAFSRITDAIDDELTKAERSNCFDEWAEILTVLSRKSEVLTSHHRKILGGLIAAVGKKDISDFERGALRVFQEATNVLRQPRVTKVESKRVIASFLSKGLNAVVALSTDNLTEDTVKQLDDMMVEILRKSQQH